MDEICVAKFDVYECRKSDRASALSGAQLNICAAQTPEFPDTIPTIIEECSCCSCSLPLTPHTRHRPKHCISRAFDNFITGYSVRYGPSTRDILALPLLEPFLPVSWYSEDTKRSNPAHIAVFMDKNVYDNVIA